MAETSGPVIVRPTSISHFVKPGLHSHNVKRRIAPERRATLHRTRALFFVIGICALGYYGYTLANQYVYQAFENWAFDRQIADGSAVTFADYLREKTPLGFLVGEKAAKPEAATATSSPRPEVLEPAHPAEGSVLGRVEIKRLNVSAMVREGADAKILSIAVGHVPSTSLPGATGNFAIAAHRDTLFRALKDIKEHDLVTFQAPTATYTYEVAGTRIVKPSDITVLRPDGGGLIPASDKAPGDNDKLLTMITCYPFYYVGSAPKRFIVEAKLVSTDDASSRLAGENAESPPNEDTTVVAVRPSTAKPGGPGQLKKKRHLWHKASHAF